LSIFFRITITVDAPKTPIDGPAATTIAEAIGAIDFCIQNPNSLKESQPSKIVSFLQGLKSEFEKQLPADLAELQLNPDEEVEALYRRLGYICEKNEVRQGNAHALLNDFTPKFRKWRRNKSKLVEYKKDEYLLHLDLPSKATSRELYEVVDQLTDDIQKHPTSTEVAFWALSNSVLEWYGEKKSQGSSRASSRPATPRVTFAERTPTPEEDPFREFSDIFSSGPSTPQRKPEEKYVGTSFGPQTPQSDPLPTPVLAARTSAYIAPIATDSPPRKRFRVEPVEIPSSPVYRPSEETSGPPRVSSEAFRLLPQAEQDRMISEARAKAPGITKQEVSEAWEAGIIE